MIAPRRTVETIRTTCWECARLALRNRAASGRNIARFASFSTQVDATSDGPPLEGPPLAQQSNPSLADLEALRPKLRPPSALALTDSPDFAVYAKRFDRAVNALSRAFKRDQILRIAQNDLQFRTLNSKSTKSAIIARIINDYWRLPDPKKIIAEEKAAVEDSVKEADPTVRESEPGDFCSHGHIVEFSLSMCPTDISITTNEVPLLLGRLGEPHVLQELSVKHDVRATLAGDPPNALQLEGLTKDIAAAKEAWQKMKKDIHTQEMPTGLAGTVRPQLCKAISAASQTLVVPSRAGKVRVTYLRSSSKAHSRVASMLRQIAWVENIELVTPSVQMQTCSGFPSYTHLPFLSHEKHGWMLSDLPLDSLSRQTSEDQSDVQPEITGDVLNILKTQLGNTSSDTVLEVRFGHQLSLSTGDGSQRVFLPSTPPDAATRVVHTSPSANMSMIRRHTADFDHKSIEYRRLVYISKPSALPLHYIECTRKRQSKQLHNEPPPTWKVTYTREALCSVEMPSAPVDARLALVEASEVPQDDLAQLASLVDQAAPSMLTVSGEEYTLFDDAFRRDTVISSGMPPWTNLNNTETILSRTRQHNTRYSSMVVRSTIDNFQAVLSALRHLARVPTVGMTDDIFDRSFH